ncbi:hypothetical protein [Streptomyces sp. NPDC095602]|uniref:hypothetical protein n=1 Tax=Streptomyces sp. NPDC095602 TaxID=3155819 RepID=UPI003319F0EE
MSQTAGGSWQCYSCGYIQLSASIPPVPAAVPCPRCDGPLHEGQDDIVRCQRAGCTYELDGPAFSVFCQVVAMWEADPAGFCDTLRARNEELRALAPYWQRDVLEPVGL